MALIFIDGFDHYTAADFTNKWSSGTSFGSMITGRFGGQAYNIQEIFGTPAISKVLPAAYTSMVLGFAFHFDSTNAYNSNLIIFQSSASEQISVLLKTDGTLNFSYGGTTLTSTNSTAYSPLTSNHWNYIEIQIGCSTSVATNACKIFLNGNLYQTLNSGQNSNNQGSGSINQFTISGVGSGGNMAIDDLYFLSIDGDTTGPLGDCKVETLYPTGAGSNAEWTPDSGSNYARVNETHADGDTSYVFSDTLDQIDSYAFGSLSSTPTTIHGVQACLWNRKDATSVRQIEPTTVIGGTAYSETPTTSMSTTYTCYTAIYRVNPQTLALWTESDIAGAEFGFTLST
jgi:hypothetical protein